MATGWETYSVIFIAALVSLWVPGLLWALSRILTPSESKRTHGEILGDAPPLQKEPEVLLGKRINTRFFLAANIAICLVAMVLLIVPFVTVLRAEGFSQAERIRGLLVVLSVLVFVSVGLLYSSRKGDLDWLSAISDAGKGVDR